MRPGASGGGEGCEGGLGGAVGGRWGVVGLGVIHPQQVQWPEAAVATLAGGSQQGWAMEHFALHSSTAITRGGGGGGGGASTQSRAVGSVEALGVVGLRGGT